MTARDGGSGRDGRDGRDGHDDRGASLVLAMVFVTCVGLVVGSLLTYASTGLRTAALTATADQAAADVAGALQTAINDVRNGSYHNAPGQSCFGSADEPDRVRKEYPARPGSLPESDDRIVVRCSPDPDSGGRPDGVELNAANQFPYALQATGSDASITKLNNGPMLVRGNVFSSNGITLSRGSQCADTWPSPNLGANCNGLFVDGSVTAGAACSTAVYPRSGTRSCNAAGPTPVTGPVVPQPAPPGVAGTAPTTAACVAATVVPFEPGVYTSAAALNALTGTGTACATNVFWFKPGIYFFDFLDAGAQTARKWVFDRPAGYLIGGSKLGWTTGAPPKFPGACLSPFADEDADGVQFVFGGTSQFEVADGRVELCASYSRTAPPVALLGGAVPSTAFRAQTGCTTTGTSCPTFILSAAGTKEPQFFLRGNVYAPKAAIDLTLRHDAAHVLQGAVVVRSAAFSTFPNATFTGAVVDRPVESGVPDPTDVYFTAWTCSRGTATPGPGACRLRGRAVARYTDGCFRPCPNGRRGVQITAWKLER